VALTLRAVGGLSTAQIAKAFLVPEATMAQRISRAKASLRGAVVRMPEPDEAEARLRAVLHVLYLIFNEGYTMSSGAALTDSTLTTEAIRLTRLLLSALPPAIPLAGSPPRPATPAPGGSRPEPPLAAVRGEVTGVLALMLLTDARRPARTGVDGSLIPLSEQDRSLWDAGSIAEGLALTDASLSRGRLGPYQVQAAIAAVHACAEKAGDTDWPQILALYGLLERIAPSPVARLNQAVALAMVNGPQAGLAMLSTLDGDLNGQHRLDAVRAHLLELAGDPAGARASYLLAARRTTSLPEQRYLTARATHLKP
jgi:predicted RNA polymerase sigma factor